MGVYQPGCNCCHMFSLESGHRQFILAGHPPAGNTGNAANAIGTAAGDFTHRGLTILRVRQANNDHTEV